MSKKDLYAFTNGTIFGAIFLGLFVFCVGIYFIISNDLSTQLCYGVIILSLAIMIGMPVIVFVNHNKKVEKFYKGIQIANIDSMDGIEFEKYLQNVLPRGKHFCMVCDGEQALKTFVSKLRRNARIMSNGCHVGRVWKDGARWNWFYDPSLVTPNKACSGRFAG